MSGARQCLLYVVALALATCSPAPPVEVGPLVVIAAGDEWALSDEAFADDATSAKQFATNVATLIGGTSYLIFQDAPYATPYGQAFQDLLTGMGRELTSHTGGACTAELLAPFDAVFLAGPPCSSRAIPILNEYVEAGGVVYLSLGTGAFTIETAPEGAVSEAASWNPFLERWGLRAGDRWFPFPNPATITIPIEASEHPLASGVSSLLWGFGQAVGQVDASSPLTDVPIEGDFSEHGQGEQGFVAVAHRPKPATSAAPAEGGS